MTDRPNGNGLYVPRWALVAGALLIAIVSATWSAAQTVARAKTDAEVMQLRMCRIERAVGIEPWPTCPAVVKP